MSEARAATNGWWGTLFFVLCATVAVLVCFALDALVGTIVLLGIALILAFAFLFNPRLRYFRAASSLLAAWVGSRGFPTVILALNNSTSNLAFYFGSEVGWLYDAACATVVVTLFVLDYRLRAPNSGLRHIVGRIGGFLTLQKQVGSGAAQQVQIGNILGDNNEIQIRNINTQRDFHADIDNAVGFIGQGKTDVALTLLLDLQKRSWDSMSDRERFRLLANLGHAKNESGDFNEAARLFIEAYAYQPADERALALKAHAHFLLGETTQARLLALSALEKFPLSEIALCIVLKTTPADEPSARAEAQVPSALRSSGDVLAALFYLRYQRDEVLEAIKYARELLQESAQSQYAKSHLGAALVRKAILAHQGVLKEPDCHLSQDLDEAIRMLTDVIESKTIANPEIKFRARYQRAFANDLIGQTELAELDFLASLDSNEPEVLYQYSLFLIRHGRDSEAISFLHRLPEDAGHLGALVLGIRLLSKTNSRPELETAICSLEKHLADSSPTDTFDLFDSLDTLLVGYAATDRQDESNPLLEKYRSELGTLSYLVLKATLSARRGEREVGTEHAIQATEHVSDEAPLPIQLWLANQLANFGEYARALAIFKKVVTLHSPTSEIRAALECARISGDLKFLLAFCKELRAAGSATNFSLDLEIVTLQSLSDFGSALEVIDEQLSATVDAKFAKVLVLRRSLIGKHLDRQELIEYDPARLPSLDDVSIEAGCATAALLASGPKPLDGVNYAYEFLRRNFDQPASHMCLVATLGLGDDHKVALPEFEQVAAGCAVVFEEDSGARGWRIIEDGPDPSGSRSEISPSSQLAMEMMGKGVGDEFILRKDPVQERRAKITNIVHKAAFRKFDTLDKWEERFHEEFFIRKYTLEKTASGEVDVAKFLKDVEKLHEPRKQIDELLRREPLSAGNYAQLSQSTPIESLLYLVHSNDLPIRCCRGTPEEYECSTKLLAGADVVVGDDSAMTTLYWTGLFRRFDQLPFRCIVSRGTLDSFRRLLQDKNAKLYSKRFLAFSPRGVVPVEQSDADVERAREYVRDFVKWIESHCEISDARALAELPVDVREEWKTILGNEAVETMAIALAKSIPIWTDDFCVAEQMASNAATGGRIWTELVIDRAASEKLIESSLATSYKVSLVNAGYVFTRVNSEMVDVACKAANWDPREEPFTSMIAWLHESGVNPIGAIRTAGYILGKANKASMLEHLRIAVVRAVIRSVASRLDAEVVLPLLQQCIPAIYGIDFQAAKEAEALLEFEAARLASERTIILPGDPDWK